MKCTLPKAGALYSKYNPDWIRVIGKDECEAFADNEELVIGHFIPEALAKRIVSYLNLRVFNFGEEGEARVILEEMTK